MAGSISAYIPFNFTSGGWYKGIIPKVSYNFTNDMFNSNVAIMSYDPEMGSFAGKAVFVGVKEGKNMCRQIVSGSIRGYSVLGTPNSAVYPKWGISFETGASYSFGSSSILSPMGYAYTYGYVPGILDSHGIKLSAMYQKKLNKNAYFGQTVVSTLPRGLADNSQLMNTLSYRNDALAKVTADYAFPVYIGDVGIIGGFLYIKRLVLSPHFDYSFVGGNGLYSAGAALTLDLNSILWLGWPVSVGVTGSYNGGTGLYKDFSALSKELGIPASRWYFGPTFNVSF